MNSTDLNMSWLLARNLTKTFFLVGQIAIARKEKAVGSACRYSVIKVED
jgi:hypothetical protein